MKPSKIAFVGYGALGKQISHMLSFSYPNHEFHVFDDIAHESKCANYTYPFSACFDEKYFDFDFYIGIGYKHLSKKLKIIESLLKLGRQLPSIIHTSSYRDLSSKVGQGAVVYPMCNLDRNSIIGKGSIINNSVVISHDCEIGDCCYLSPGCVLSGQVKIGSCVFLGTGVLVANGVTIGSNAVVGIGSVVTSDVPSGASVIGNPMRLLKKTLQIL
jgi:sugar O-acyltransferase (sialic acid O-acetyltransferase NeuD family)